MALALLHALDWSTVPLKHPIAFATWHLLQVFMGAYADITSLSRFALRFYLRTLYWFRRARPRASKHSLALATWQLLNVFMCACADITYEFSWLDRQKYHFSKKYHFSNRGFVVAFPRALNLLWLSCTQCICGGAGFAVGRRGVELPPPPPKSLFSNRGE